MNTQVLDKFAVSNKLLTSLMWPLALIVVLHRTWALPQNPYSTDDFTTVWRAIQRFVNQVPVYNETYVHTNPHYLYSPGGTLLLSPMALFGTYDITRLSFAIIQSIAIIIGLTLLLRWLGVARGSWLLPFIIMVAFHTEGVSNTLSFTNVNGSLFLAVVLFLVLLTPKQLRSNILAGLIIGVALTIKPVVAPLLVLPLLRKQFSAIAAAVVVPVLANAIAWQLMVQPRDYIDLLVPYLKIVRDYANSSLAGQLTWLGANPALILLWQLFFAAFIGVSFILLLRWRDRDEVFWLATNSGLILTTAFFLSSLGQQYYSILLLPLFLSFLRPLVGARDSLGLPAPTVMRNWPMGLAAGLCLFYGNWEIENARLFSSWLTIAVGAFGWGLLILAMAGTMIHLTLQDHFAGRPFSEGMDWVKNWFRFRARPSSVDSKTESKTLESTEATSKAV